MSILSSLSERLTSLTGGDPTIDQALAEAFDVPVADFSESAEKSRNLVLTVLPDWHLHVGFGASGLFPYASLTRGELHVEAEAPSLPLALLRVLVRAKSEVE